MGLFRTSLDEVEKWRQQGKSKKLIRALHAHDEAVALAAFRALTEMIGEESLGALGEALFQTPHSEVYQAAESFIRERADWYAPFAANQAELLAFYHESSTEWANMAELVRRKQDFLTWLGAVAEPHVEALLDREHGEVRVRAAEILERIGTDSSRDRWEYVLRVEKRVLEKGLKFESPRLFNHPVEVPLVEVRCKRIMGLGDHVESIFTGDTGHYWVGLTDEAVHAAPYSYTTPGYYRQPIPRLHEIKCDGERFEFRPKADDPGLEVLAFTVGGTDFPPTNLTLPRVREMVRLFDALKGTELTKLEIIEQYYDPENLRELNPDQ